MKKLKLNELQVKSFLSAEKKSTIKGGICEDPREDCSEPQCVYTFYPLC